MEEIWRPIPGRDGYEVSDLGRVRSVDRTIIRMTKRGPVQARLRGRVLQPINAGAGYCMVTLGRDRRYVHELVLTAFVGPRPAGQQAAHYDGDKTNDALGNIRWASRAENEADKLRHGTRLRGAMTPNGRKTSCKRGHLFDSTNTGRGTNGSRRCRTCERTHQRRRRNTPPERWREPAKRTGT